MAEREHQGYQIALVIFVMLTVLLSITTFMFFKKYREEQQKNGEVTAQYNTATNERNTLDNRLINVLPLLGYDKDDTLDTIAKDVEGDRQALSAYLTNLGGAAAAPPADGFDDGFGDAAATEISNPLNYREVTKQLKTELDKQNAAVVQLTADKQALEQQVAANRAEDKAKNDALLAGQTAAQTELASERDKFNQGRTEQQGQLATLTGALTKKDADLEAMIKELNDKIAALTTQDRARNTLLAEFRDEKKLRTPREFETIDGRITAVLPRERMVYINLGSADGLRPQVTFSVYGQESAKLVATESKAEVEVTQISGSHSAIARVLTDSRSNPILPGDAIFSPAFHPGVRVRFAIVGDIDINGDGRSDRQKIRDLIATNNGIIDVELDDDGKLLGEARPLVISPATRYLIKGNPPTDEKVLAQYSRLIGQADEAGTVTLTMQQFLGMVGYKTDERTVDLGKAADPRDFPPKPSASAYDKPGASRFRERRPPAAAAEAQ